jgi:hypothetical protein
MDRKKHFYRMGNHSGGWDDLPVDSDELDTLINSARKPIEPWLSAVFQAEHPTVDRDYETERPYIELSIYSAHAQPTLETSMRLHAIVAATVILGPHSAYALEPGQYPPCKQAGLEYTEGATICECPSLKAEAGHATGGPPGLVVSGRLQCRSGAWVATDTKCVELTGRSEYLVDDALSTWSMSIANSTNSTVRGRTQQRK